MKFLLFDDHKIFSRSFQLLLREAGYNDVIICETAQCIQHLIINEGEFLIFCDYIMPGIDIFPLILKWKSFKNVKIVMMSGIINSYQIARLLRNNVDGFLSKSAEPDEINTCIEEVVNKRIYISKDIQNEVMKILISKNETLFTARELEIINLIKEGKSIKEKAQILCLSENTIIVHRKNIMQKAGVKTITELVIKIDTLL